MRRPAVAAIGCALLAGCATRPSPAVDDASPGTAPEMMAAANDTPGARCAAVADSVRSSTAMANLPFARSDDRSILPVPRGKVVGEIHARYLVDPTGKVVPGTMMITGARDAEFRRDLEEMLMRRTYRPPMVEGCPSWSRGDFRMRARG